MRFFFFFLHPHKQGRGTICFGFVPWDGRRFWWLWIYLWLDGRRNRAAMHQHGLKQHKLGMSEDG